MKKAVLASIVFGVAAAFGTTAMAQDTITRERTTTAPGIGVQVPGVSVGIGVPGASSTTTTTTRETSGVARRDCDTQTTRRDGPDGSTTVRRERCD